MGRKYKKLNDITEVVFAPTTLPDNTEKHWQDIRDELFKDKVSVTGQTENHKKLIRAILTNVITFVTGCAGTGKTHLPCGVAAQLLSEGKIDKIVLTRPQVEVGNKSSGYFPGDPIEKILPYIYPLINELGHFLGPKNVDKLIKDKVIHILPLNLMRGASIKNSIILADECQNAAYTELKMLLTRIDKGTRIVIAADNDQTDIQNNDLIQVLHKLYDLKDEIAFIKMGPEDIMRAGIVRKILERL